MKKKRKRNEEMINMKELLNDDIKSNIIDTFYEKLNRIIQEGNRNEELEKYLERYPDRWNAHGFFPCKGSKSIYFKPSIKNTFEELIKIAGEEYLLKKMKKDIIKRSCIRDHSSGKTNTRNCIHLNNEIKNKKENYKE